MAHIHLFNTETDFNAAYTGSGYTKPWVSYTKDVERVDYNKWENPYLSQYLTFVALENTTFCVSNLEPITMEYSLDGGNTWTEIKSLQYMDSAYTPTIYAGNSIMWKGVYTSNIADRSIISTGKFNVEGNVMSIIYGDNFIGQTSLAGKDYGLYKLFNENTNVVNAQNMVLPATTLTDSCYASMFRGCTSLTSAPELPATTLAGGCYTNMFSGCTSLTSAPELPATTTEISCYANMFRGCTSLTSAPELPATTLAFGCYQSMFQGCTNLNNIKCFATNISAQYCTDSWVEGVASSGTFITPQSTSWTTGNNGIPTNWTRVDA